MRKTNERLAADFKKYVLEKQQTVTTYTTYPNRTTFPAHPMYANNKPNDSGYVYKRLNHSELVDLNGGSYNVDEIGHFPTSQLDECNVFYYESCSMHVSCRHFCSIDALIAYCKQLNYNLTSQQITQIRMCRAPWYLCRNPIKQDHFFIRRTKDELAKVISDAWVERHAVVNSQQYIEKFYN